MTDIANASYPTIVRLCVEDELEPPIYRALVALRKGLSNGKLGDNRVNLAGGCLFINYGVENLQECIDILTDNEIIAPGGAVFVNDVFLCGKDYYSVLALTNISAHDELGLPGFFLNDVPSLTIEKLFRHDWAPWFSQALSDHEP